MGPFSHEAVLYSGEDGFLACVLPFVTGGLRAGEPVLAAVSESRVTALRSALGSDAYDYGAGGAIGIGPARVELRDMTEIGHNPGRIIPWVLRAFIDQHAGHAVRIIGDSLWAGRPALEYPACVQHEALINLALAADRVMVLCPYDTALLAPQMLADVDRTHPTLMSDGRQRSSETYASPESVLAALNVPLDEPAESSPALSFDVGDLGVVRDFVAAHGRRAGLPLDRIADLQLAANEIATNSVKHGGGRGTLRIWKADGAVVCEIRDAGSITDPLVGRVPPNADSDRGRGLLLVNFLCDLVRIHTGSEGTAVRLYLNC